MYCVLNTHHLHLFGIRNTAVWSVNGKFHFLKQCRFVGINTHMFQAFGLLRNVNSTVPKSRLTVWQLFKGELLLEGEVVR
jgi:hypothetical protein